MTKTPLNLAVGKISALLITPTVIAICVFFSGTNVNQESNHFLVSSTGINLAGTVDRLPNLTDKAQISRYVVKAGVDDASHNAFAPIDSPVKVRKQALVAWGLDRIDQRAGTNSRYTFAESGAGVTVYILDTGILAEHSEFRNQKTRTTRVLPGYSVIAGGTEDCNGHGTHVAGTIGSRSFGVAKAVSLVPVRVLDCSGEGAVKGVIQGLNWVTRQASAVPKIAILSFVSDPSTALDAAVNELIESGTTVVVAAGNNGGSACNYSPSRVPDAITVAASDSNDNLARFSNRGRCVDIIAPGSSIKSSWHTSSVASKTISGTSMASPHVAGAIALLFQRFGPRTPSEMQQIVKSLASKDVVKKLPAGTPNLLLHTDPKNKIFIDENLGLASATQATK